jgi:hypothetical protein
LLRNLPRILTYLVETTKAPLLCEKLAAGPPPATIEPLSAGVIERSLWIGIGAAP